MLRKIEGSWPRREHFQHYMYDLRCTFSLTVQIDITQLRSLLKAQGIKAYPAQIYMLATTVNRFAEFRMGMTESGDPGFWDDLHPSYTILNPATKTFSSIYTPYQGDFSQFYPSCLKDMERYQSSDLFAPQKDMPPNVFNISSVPWIDFTAFNLNVYGEDTYLSPIFTIGKYVEQQGKTLLPLAMQLHHAACDGYHAGQFVEALRDMAATGRQWLSSIP